MAEDITLDEVCLLLHAPYRTTKRKVISAITPFKFRVLRRIKGLAYFVIAGKQKRQQALERALSKSHPDWSVCGNDNVEVILNRYKSEKGKTS
jgi:hypothetical protein